MSDLQIKVHDVLIIGLGHIGAKYDEMHSPSEYVLTHARAFQLHPSFRLVGGVDLDVVRCYEFQKKYDCPTFQDISEAVYKTKPSVVVVATPTEIHCSAIQTILAIAAPLAILCEKPISFDPLEAHVINELCKEKNCSLYINYMRLSDIGVSEIFKRIKDGSIALPVRGVAWYSKGLFNSASHFVNLLQYLLGDVKKLRVLEKGRLLNDIDPEPDFEIEFVKGKIHFLALRFEDYFHNSIELMAANGRLRFEYGGRKITWETTVTNPVFLGYTTLSDEPELLMSDFYRQQFYVVDQLAAALAGKPSKICSGNQALSTLDLIKRIKENL